MRRLRWKSRQDEYYEGGHGPEYRHSFMYKRLFEDYRTIEYIDEKGNIRSKSIYVGRIYTPPFPQSAFRLRKLLYALLWIAAAVLTYIGGSLPIPVNMHPLTVAMLILAIAGLCWVMISVGNYCLAHYNRTIGEHKTSTKMFPNATIWCAGVLGALALEGLVFLAIDRENLRLQLLSVACYLVGAAALLLLRTLEKRVVYTITFSADAPPQAIAEEEAEDGTEP